MRVYSGISQVRPEFPSPVVAIGVFDGIHRGHQRLLKTVVRRARRLGGTPAVMTFHPHPVRILRPQLHLPLIISLGHRLALLEEHGITLAVVVRFTRSFARLTPSAFVRRYLVERLRPAEVVVGDDFRFGADRSGGLDAFCEESARYGFRLTAVPTAGSGRHKTGSRVIRRMIMAGDLAGARRRLGRPVSVLGRVVRGDGRGAALGFPTANMKPEGELLPPPGVYAVRVHAGHRTCGGMANIGTRPSFGRGGRLTIEAHLFEFSGDLYGRTILVEFLRRLRDERKFPDRDALVRQLQRDERAARRILR